MKLVDPEKQCISDDVYMSLLTELSLSDYVLARAEYCQVVHKQPCFNCSQMLTVANTILQHGFCMLSEAHHIVSPDTKFRAENARSKLLQMPLVCVRLGEPKDGTSFSFLMEKHNSVNPMNIATVLNSMASKKQPKSLDKSFVKLLLNLAGSECARECVRYAVVEASALSSTQARKQYGFENMQERSSRLESAIKQVQVIRETVDHLASIQDEALLTSFGISTSRVDQSESDEESGSEELLVSETSDEEPEQGSVASDELVDLIHKSRYNWFEFCEHVPDDSCLSQFYADISKLFNAEVKLITQSQSAYYASEIDLHDQVQAARAINGEVLTDSESDTSDDQVFNPLDNENIRRLVKKKRDIKETSKTFVCQNYS